MSGKLMVVGTPIGNLSDFSPRAAETLREADFIAAEDTRVTLKLLNHFGIKKPMVSYFEHNKRERGDVICARIEAGETCALVSDAGMAKDLMENGLSASDAAKQAAAETGFKKGEIYKAILQRD